MIAPKLPSLFKTSRNKQFEYKPIYYDEAKERMQERINRIKQELGIANAAEPPDTAARMKVRFSEKWNRKHYNKQVTHSNLRIIAILAAMAVFMWYVFK